MQGRRLLYLEMYVKGSAQESCLVGTRFVKVNMLAHFKEAQTLIIYVCTKRHQSIILNYGLSHCPFKSLHELLFFFNLNSVFSEANV